MKRRRFGHPAFRGIAAVVLFIFAKNRRVIYACLVGFSRSPWPDREYTLDDHLA